MPLSDVNSCARVRPYHRGVGVKSRLKWTFDKEKNSKDKKIPVCLQCVISLICSNIVLSGTYITYTVQQSFQLFLLINTYNYL